MRKLLDLPVVILSEIILIWLDHLFISFGNCSTSTPAISGFPDQIFWSIQMRSASSASNSYLSMLQSFGVCFLNRQLVLRPFPHRTYTNYTRLATFSFRISESILSRLCVFLRTTPKVMTIVHCPYKVRVCLSLSHPVILRSVL